MQQHVSAVCGLCLLLILFAFFNELNKANWLHINKNNKW